MTGLLGYNDLHAIVMHALNWERRFIERRSVHPSSAYDKQRFCPGFFRLDPYRSPNARPALRDDMILAYEIMKWTAKSTNSAEFTLAPQYSPP